MTLRGERWSAIGDARVEGALRTVDVEGEDGAVAVRVENVSASGERFERAVDAASPLDRGDGWAVVPGSAVDAIAAAVRDLPAADPIKVTVRAEGSSRGQIDREPPRAAVVLSPARLRGLTPDQRSAAAGLAGLPISALDGLAAADLPLVLQPHRRSSSARRAAEVLARETGLPVEAATGGGVLVPLWAATLATTAAMTALGTITFAMLGVWLFVVFGALLTAGLGAFATHAAWTWNGRRSLLARAVEAEREADEERARRSANPHLSRAWSALADARVALASAELPGAAAGDLRGVLKAVEQELEDLETRSRRGSGPAAARVDTDARRLEAVLAEVTEAIGRWQTDAEDEALDAIVAATRHARERHLVVQ